MRIGAVILSLLFMFGLFMSLMTTKVKEKNQETKQSFSNVKILNWKKVVNGDKYGIAFKIRQENISGLIEPKKLNCKLLDEKQKEIDSLSKGLFIKKSGTRTIFIEKDKTILDDVKYLDCSFI